MACVSDWEAMSAAAAICACVWLGGILLNDACEANCCSWRDAASGAAAAAACAGSDMGNGMRDGGEWR